MNKIKKALDVLKSDCKNPLIIKDMIDVLEREFKVLEDSLDASCNHNAELSEQIESLVKAVCKIPFLSGNYGEALNVDVEHNLRVNESTVCDIQQAIKNT